MLEWYFIIGTIFFVLSMLLEFDEGWERWTTGAMAFFAWPLCFIIAMILLCTALLSFISRERK